MAKRAKQKVQARMGTGIAWYAPEQWARLLELSEDLAGVQSIPGPVEQRVIPARRTDTRWHGLGHIPGRLLHPHRGFTAG